MMRSIKSEGNTIYVLYSLLKKIKVSVSKVTIKKDLLDHPNYPSVLAIGDCLSSWRVPNETFSVQKDTIDLNKLPLPFIAHIHKNGEEFILVESITENVVRFSNENEVNGMLTKSEFLRLWDGILLIAEKDENSGEKEFRQSLIKSFITEVRLPLLVAMVLGCVLYSIDFNSSSLSFLGLVAIKLIGVGVSSLLLMHSINANNPFIQNICSLGKKNNCNAILKSDAAKVSSWLSWSEVGMFYFAGSLICLLVEPLNITLLSWLNILCLPYTIYSIGYQIKIKNWCVLCCTVQALLWIEFGVFYVSDVSFEHFNISFSTVISTSLSFLIPLAIWAYIKPYLLKSEQSSLLKLQLKKIKYNSTVFNQLMSAQAKHVVNDDLMPIILGNPESKTIITMVSNPYCGPCAVAHKTLDEWLIEREDIQLQILFTPADYQEGERVDTIKHLMSLSGLPDKTLIKQALNDWYDQDDKNYNKWAEKYPISKNNNVDVAFLEQKNWVEIAGVTFTPTIFIDGNKLLNLYNLEDIKYLLP